MVRDIGLAGFSFARHVVGIITRPYETYRHIVEHGSTWELVYIGVLCALYFFVAALLRTSLYAPFLLTRQFFTVFGVTGLTFLFIVGIYWASGRMFRHVSIKGILMGWGYSLVPTLLWFWMTSILYVIVPPPRTTSVLGVAFSIVYLLLSATLLFWKITLSYLALRFGLRLDLMKILLINLIILPLIGLYSIEMYRLGIFRVPFI